MTPQTLLQHHDNGQLWPALADEPDFFADVPAAYQVALQVAALRRDRGEEPRGFKIGFTNRSIWPRYNVFAPIWGRVWHSTLVLCDGQATLPVGRLCQPRIEPEIVFGFKSRPAAGADLQALFDALDWLAPGFELVQTHRPEWKFNAAHCVADGGLHGRLVVGLQLPVQSLAANAQQLHQTLAAATVQLRCNGQAVEAGSGAQVLGSPLHALLHLLTELRACPGAPDIEAGDLVTTGTWTDAWPVFPGQQWQAEFSAPLPGLGLLLR
jgi:2-oxo-3-hexenedioate decarboxylase